MGIARPVWTLLDLCGNCWTCVGIARPVWALLDLCGHGTGLREQGERKEDRRKEKQRPPVTL